MNRVEELIQQLCPNGVEWKKLGEVCDYEQPAKYIVKSTNYNPQFQTPVLTAGQSFVLGYTDEAYGIYKANTQHPVIIFDDFTTSFQWVDFDFKVKSSAIKILIPSCESVLLRFVYYLMRTIHFEAVEHTRYWISRYSQIEIPIPPLPIQQEIVRILDTFTELQKELTANLQTELDARKKQYAYYRDCLLNFEGVDGVEWKKLGEVCEKTYNIKWDTCDNIYQYIDLSSVNINNHNIEETQEINKENAPSRAQQIVLYNDVLLGTTRPMLKRICIIPLEYNEQICSTGFCVLRVNKNILLPRFLYFFISTNSFFDYVEKNQEGAGYPSISNIKIFKFQIPVPPLPEQRRIVAILDKFETLVNDLSVGLPAELEARRKQYEYYRDKLLTFDRV